MSITLIHGTNYTLVSKKLDEWVKEYSNKSPQTELKYISGVELDVRELPQYLCPLPYLLVKNV